MTTRTTNRDSSRTYTVPTPDGGKIEVPSVTTILNIVAKPALTYWAAKQVATYAADNLSEVAALVDKGDRDGAIRLLKGSPWSKRDRAANVGTEVHHTIEQLILGVEAEGVGIAEVSPQALPYISAFRDFADAFPAGTFEASEMTVFSITHGYAGTLDALWSFKGRRAVIDLKTRQGKTVDKTGAYETELLQVAAYASAEYAEMPDGSIVPLPEVDGGMLLLLCDDGYKTERVDVAAHFPAFLAARHLFDWKAGL